MQANWIIHRIVFSSKKRIHPTGQDLWREFRAQLSWIAHKQRTSVNSLKDSFGFCSKTVGGKEGFRKGTETEGQESEALQLIFPLWRPGWEEQHQAASVLLWDVLPVQTNRPRASGLMGTRPARGPNLLCFFLSFSSLSLPPPPPPLFPPLSTTNAPLTRTPAEGRTSIILNRPEKIPLPFIKLSHTAILHDIPSLYINADLLDPQGIRFQWPVLITTDTLSLTFAYFLYHSSPFPLSVSHVHTQSFPCICLQKRQSFWQSVSTFLHPSTCITREFHQMTKA